MSTVAHVGQAIGARGLSPPAKLVLLLVALRADMDGHVFAPYDGLIDEANVTPAYFRALMFELTEADLACFGSATDPHDDQTRDCILLMGADPDGR